MHTLVAGRLLASPEYTACQQNVPAVVNVTGFRVGYHTVGDGPVPAADRTGRAGVVRCTRCRSPSTAVAVAPVNTDVSNTGAPIATGPNGTNNVAIDGEFGVNTLLNVQNQS